MIGINDLRRRLLEYLGHDDFLTKKYSLKEDGKRGYCVVIFGKDSRPLPCYLKFEGLMVYLMHDRVDVSFLTRPLPDHLMFRTYELIDQSRT